MEEGRVAISLRLLLSAAYFINGCVLQVTRDGGMLQTEREGMLQMEGDVADGEGECCK